MEDGRKMSEDNIALILKGINDRIDILESGEFDETMTTDMYLTDLRFFKTIFENTDINIEICKDMPKGWIA
mgnify:CR=1 FL=1